MIYVMDMADTNHIKEFSPSGQLLIAFGADGANVGQISSAAPIDGPQTPLSFHGCLAIGTHDTFYVADQGNHRVQSYDRNGNFQFTWGLAAPSPNTDNLPFAFYQMGGVSVLPGGQVCVENLYWAPCCNSPGDLYGEIQVYDATGNYQFIKNINYQNGDRAFISSGSSSAIGVSPDGIVWAMGATMQLYC